MTRSNLLVFSTQAYLPLARELAASGGFEMGEFEREIFPDGERYLRLTRPVAARSVVLVGGTVSDSDTMELFDAASGLVHYGVERLTMVIPFYGHGTMERVTAEGEIVTAKTRARLLSAIPPSHAGNRVVLLDLHAEGIPFYFEGALRPVHLSARTLIVDEIKKLGLKDYVMACTDAGRAKWVQGLANDLGKLASFVFKKRVSASETEVIAMNADVRGRAVVIYDDMIRSGSSLIKAAKAYKAAGASDIYAIATHGILPGESLTKITQSGLFKKVIVTDSHPEARRREGGLLSVVSVAPLLASYLKTDV